MASQYVLQHSLRSVVYIALLTVLFVLQRALYNLYFHPLSHVSGPFLARLSRLWARIGNREGRKSHRIHEAHQKYGPIVRIGPNELSFAEPEAVREIYTSPAFVKEETFYRAKRIYHENHLMSFRNPEAHAQCRKLLSRGYSAAAMQQFEPQMASSINAMLDQWAVRTKSSPEIDVFPWSHMLGFDIVYQLMFDQDPGQVRTGTPSIVMKYIRAWRPTFIYKEFVPQVEWLGVYLPGRVGGYFRDVRAWKEYAVDIIRACRDKGTSTPLLSHALTSPDLHLHRPLTDSELAEECMGGMFGGSGTTANTFIYILWACLRHPSIVEKLKTELRAALPAKDTVPAYRTCQSLPYLQAVIDETLRLYPTIIATLPRTALEDVSVRGTPVPRGTIVGTQNYTVHRSAAHFPDPEAFRPERWLSDEDDAEQQSKMREAFTPFSVGPRRCIGVNLALMELGVLTAAFFRRFEARVHEGMRGEEEMWLFDAFSASPAGGRLVVELWEEGD